VVWTETVSDVVNAEEMTDQETPGIIRRMKEREEMPNNALVDGVEVLDVERVIWEGWGQ
jgi:hypothetical protein